MWKLNGNSDQTSWLFRLFFSWKLSPRWEFVANYISCWGIWNFWKSNVCLFDPGNSAQKQVDHFPHIQSQLIFGFLNLASSRRLVFQVTVALASQLKCFWKVRSLLWNPRMNTSLVTGSPRHKISHQLSELLLHFFTFSDDFWVASCFKIFGCYHFNYLGTVCIVKASEVVDDRSCINVRKLN